MMKAGLDLVQSLRKVRVIAFYLPQFHPIPENDEWYGRGFTEWTNVGKAKPLFRHHDQPRVPADLGYYDLRLPETRQAQAEMAGRYGIEGFCYWHYWFGNGKRLLERPFQEVLASGAPRFPFCLAWANHSWKMKTWDARVEDRVLVEQMYTGEADYTDHFRSVLPAFRDERYITIDGKPLFVIFDPFDSSEIKTFIDLWRRLAIAQGLPGIYFVGQSSITRKREILSLGFDAIYTITLTLYQDNTNWKKLLRKIRMRVFDVPLIYRYERMMQHYYETLDNDVDTIPSLLPNWDHSPRSGKKALVLVNSTPQNFQRYAKKILSTVVDKPPEKRLVFLRSWNEWGEGNYIEPDQRYGMQYLEALKEAVESFEPHG